MENFSGRVTAEADLYMSYYQPGTVTYDLSRRYKKKYIGIFTKSLGKLFSAFLIKNESKIEPYSY